jgi:acetolactate decarboxylase
MKKNRNPAEIPSRSVFLALLLGLLFITGCVHRQGSADAIYQTSTVSALMEGAYDGGTSFRELRKHGDFGIGTLDALDGEMLGLKGRFYQIRSDGRVYTVGDGAKTSFAVVKFFRPDETLVIDKAMDCRQLEAFLDSKLHLKNIFYAIEVEGSFSSVKARSVPAQKKPYPLLAEAAKGQAVFEFHDVKGVLAGFRTPEQAAGINVPGYHFHFLSADATVGGHVLSCLIEKAKISVDAARELFLVMPEKNDFGDSQTPEARRRELERIEK